MTDDPQDQFPDESPPKEDRASIGPPNDPHAAPLEGELAEPPNADPAEEGGSEP